MVILWLVVALGATAALVYLAARRARRLQPPLELPPGESLPSTPLQRLARLGLALTLICFSVAAGIVIAYGPQVYWDDDQVRLTAMGFMLAGLAAFAFVGARAGLWMKTDDGQLDERDRAILSGASSGQSGAILVTLAVWQIALAETFRAAGAVPIVFLYLMFWSCMMMTILAWLSGIVIGYRRN